MVVVPKGEYANCWVTSNIPAVPLQLKTAVALQFASCMKYILLFGCIAALGVAFNISSVGLAMRFLAPRFLTYWLARCSHHNSPRHIAAPARNRGGGAPTGSFARPQLRCPRPKPTAQESPPRSQPSILPKSTHEILNKFATPVGPMETCPRRNVQHASGT